MPTDSQIPGKGPGKKELKPSEQFLRFSGLGFQMTATIGLAGWFGYSIDQKLNSLPLFLILFVIGALVGSIIFLIRSTRNNLP